MYRKKGRYWLAAGDQSFNGLNHFLGYTFLKAFIFSFWNWLIRGQTGQIIHKKIIKNCDFRKKYGHEDRFDRVEKESSETAVNKFYDISSTRHGKQGSWPDLIIASSFWVKQTRKNDFDMAVN